MSASTSSSTSLNITLAHAISYLTRPLILSYPATTIIKLQLLLEANLTALYAPTWNPQDPTRGSGRRCLVLSPNTLPPRPIYTACASAGVQWADWIGLLSKGSDIEFFVDPARVAIRMGKGTPVHTIWSNDTINPPLPASRGHKPSLSVTITAPPSSHSSRKSLAQQLEDDMANDENELFAMLADQISVPTWQTPTHDHFSLSSTQPPPPSWLAPSSRSDHFPSCDSPLSDISSGTASTYSRSSSRSDYYFDGTSSPSSTSSPPSSRRLGGTTLLPNTSSHSPKSSLSRRERALEAREATVVVDLSKTEVTPYDNGKVGVLTGGVMLGGGIPPPTKSSSKTRPSSMIAIPPACRPSRV